MVENSAHLPTGHKFTLYRDEEGVYVLESQQEKGPIVDGLDVNELVAKMVKVIPEWPTMSELARGYTANAAHALKLHKEFEPLSIEAMAIADKMREYDAG